jgi:hypothetical protein
MNSEKNLGLKAVSETRRQTTPAPFWIAIATFTFPPRFAGVAWIAGRNRFALSIEISSDDYNIGHTSPRAANESAQNRCFCTESPIWSEIEEGMRGEKPPFQTRNSLNFGDTEKVEAFESDYKRSP